MRRLLLGAIAAICLSACETTPVPVVMEDAAFQAAIANAKTPWHPYNKMNAMDAIIANNVLSPAQTSRILYERAVIQTDARINLPEAVNKLNESRSLTTTTLFSSNFQTVMSTAQSELSQAQSRLNGLQTLPDWFDDMVAVGKLDEAAERYRQSGLAPDPYDAATLEAAGYLCRQRILGKSDDFTLGENIDHLKNIDWCTQPENS
ncbi:hypothetical protein [Henriciella litoralis]|uniref:hypothetical protein n=1 Tax=Henriciella litoralis TaxID=568102 RepID=UPI000A002A3C|nr:hypothetical protein [Henriciella litoralis]